MVPLGGLSLYNPIFSSLSSSCAYIGCSFWPGIHGAPGLRTDRSELVRDRTRIEPIGPGPTGFGLWIPDFDYVFLLPLVIIDSRVQGDQSVLLLLNVTWPSQLIDSRIVRSSNSVSARDRGKMIPANWKIGENW